MGAVQQNI